MKKQIAKHTALQSILLHLIPGIIVVATSFFFAPFIIGLGLPSQANQIGIILGMVPVQLGILLFVVKRKTGTYSIKTMFPYLEKSSFKEYAYFIPIMAVYALIIDAFITPLEIGLRDSLFSFIPNVVDSSDLASFSTNIIIVTVLLSVVFNGFVAPVIEEFYFRGYLLPRIPLSPIGTVIANAVLFSLYHFFSPWFFFSRVLMMIPLYYWVVKKKNIRFAIVAHIIANCFWSLSLLSSLM